MPNIIGPVRDLEADFEFCQRRDFGVPEEANRFIREAREGWPYAIRRALAAEAEIDRLRDEIRMLQEQLEQRCARA